MSEFGYGSDMAGGADIGRDLRPERDGRRGLLNWVVRALSTDRLWYADDWGVDIRQYIGTDTPAGIVESRVVNALIRDERIVDARAEVGRVGGRGEEMTIGIAIRASDDTTFDLTLRVTNLTVELLKESGQA